ncbi:hypothetical protein AMTRI_Chr11g157820 [Amborella trichopoda]|uniref:pre-rRNA-processing protein ESF2 isoform X1 n=1 Tax=Amborella trichopoda TaxID=13333 RepID=UPI0005D463BC|nr:pre-rRNA-processing protein ESF2 isoform X1 [Amborella trichopoda]XP_020531831.1 pre-rRNA-processing protein ESF2 isoform X1 [Amborella trichopoda]XP_020531832.1 pre-rRNA-processing protein ESF2 isoform X1 [Amborella trichopoda]|eukprot:XP_006858558.2 pre-rRNA-processing protein ESF2 isoform X1 [Amborella trichopoda]
MAEEDETLNENGLSTDASELNTNVEDDEEKIAKEKRKKRLLKEKEASGKRGVCYLSRVPPHMDHVKLRHILSQYGEILRIYLAPEDPTAKVHRKRIGGNRGHEYSEGWVEFAKKSVAKRVANMLNGEQIGGKRRSSFYYDLWNIKYLRKFKWDNLTEEIAYKNAVREQKLGLEISAAKRERDFYLSKVDQSRALASIREREKKKKKVAEQDSDCKGGGEVENQEEVKVVRRFPQTRPIADNTNRKEPRLSKEVLAGVFGGPSV